jgi:hypothetical protein
MCLHGPHHSAARGKEHTGASERSAPHLRSIPPVVKTNAVIRRERTSVYSIHDAGGGLRRLQGTHRRSPPARPCHRRCPAPTVTQKHGDQAPWESHGAHPDGGAPAAFLPSPTPLVLTSSNSALVATFFTMVARVGAVQACEGVTDSKVRGWERAMICRFSRGIAKRGR